MGALRPRTGTARVAVDDAVPHARPKAVRDAPPAVVGPQGALAWQRHAGNAVVTAMVTAQRLRAPPRPLQRLPEEPGGTATAESAAGVATQPEVPQGWMALPFPMATWHEVTRGTQLGPEETERRRKLLQEAAIKVAPNYPWAAALLLRWLAGNAKEQLLNLTPEQLLRDDSGFPTAVRTSIRDVLRKGVEARLAPTHPEHVAAGQPSG